MHCEWPPLVYRLTLRAFPGTDKTTCHNSQQTWQTPVYLHVFDVTEVISEKDILTRNLCAKLTLQVILKNSVFTNVF